MKKIFKIVLSFLLILSLIGCGNEILEEDTIGEFSAQDFEGDTVTEKIFSEYDLTMVNLWTTTCSYCIEEMPYLEELRQEFVDEGKNFNIISLCMDLGKVGEINEDNLAIAKEIIEKTEVTYKNLIPDDNLLNGRLKDVQAFPESFFVNRDGKIVSQAYIGANSKNHWRVIMKDEFSKIEN